jgi:hypothetical protein
MMHRGQCWSFVAIVCAFVPHPRALAAQIGHFPLLEEVADSSIRCKRLPATDELRRAGAAAQVQIKSAEDTNRTIAIGVTAKGRPKVLTDMIGRSVGWKLETETLTAFLDPAGAVVSGSRTYETSGTASRIKDNKRSGLFPEDTARIVMLANEMIRKC